LNLRERVFIWLTKTTFSSAAQPKTVYSQDKDMEYRNGGLISVRCKDGFKMQGYSVVACRNGQLNSTFPQCIPSQSKAIPLKFKTHTQNINNNFLAISTEFYASTKQRNFQLVAQVVY
jgi:hypothetical protein